MDSEITQEIYTENKLAIGVDLGGTKIGIAMVNCNGKIIHYLKNPTDAHKGKEFVINNIIESIHQLLNEAEANLDDISGIGVGIPGQLDVRTGIVHFAPNLPGWEEVPICRIIKEEFNVPVVLENDANAAAWGEKTFGAAKGIRDMVCLTLGTGIGGGLILDGKIYRGHKCGAGEIGHIIVNKDGPDCHCGGIGCLEAYSSATGIKNRVADKIKYIKENSPELLADTGIDITNIRLVDIFQRARENDPLVKDIVNEAIEYLGVGITILVNLLNPEMVVLVGGIANEGENILTPIRNFVFKRAMKAMLNDLKIDLGKLKEKAGVLGAAALLWQKNN
ncbi:MAG: ROK family protein [Atribacterota bacterium]|jgi:glucokinase|nr:ROK family protein [Atribacterota bacterium]MDD4288418.1 ROK family protein [Atribacterota bacterium]MDD4765099.1 ROK family protein [Atribacterota bacterium]